MNKLLNKDLKVNIPYYSVNGHSIISKITEMNEIQSRIALLIVSYKELKIGALTLKEAIQQVFGLIPNNLPIIKEDVNELLKTETIKKLTDDIFDTKVMILYLKMNKGIREDIESKEKYSLLTSSSKKVKKSLAVEMFPGFGIKENPTFSKQDEISIYNSKKYTDDQYKDLIEQFIKISDNETIGEIELDSEEASVAWITKKLKVEISDEIKPLNDESELILDLISNGNLDIDPEKILNAEVEKFNLSSTNEKLDVVENINETNLQDSNQVIDTKFVFNKYGVTKYYESSFTSKLNDKNVEIKELVSKDEMYTDLFKKEAKSFTPEILENYSSEAKKEFINVISSGVKASTEVRKYLLPLLSIKVFKELDVNEVKNFISSKELFDDFFEINVERFKKDSLIINKLLELGYSSEKWLLKHTGFQYSGERVFHNWDEEDNFFKTLNETKAIDLSSKTKDEIGKIISKFNDVISDDFKNQRIYKDFNAKLEKLKSIASEWSEDKIIAEGMKLRDKLESLNNSFSKLGDRHLTFNEIATKYIKEKYAIIMTKSYKQLSNFLSHNITKTSNLAKEKIVKDNIKNLQDLFELKKNELKLEVVKKEISSDDNSDNVENIKSGKKQKAGKKQKVGKKKKGGK